MESHAIFRTFSEDFSTFVRLEGVRPGVELMYHLLHLRNEFSSFFAASVISEETGDGWRFETTNSGVAVEMLISDCANGFGADGGISYCWRKGVESESVLCPSTEGKELPKCCFVGREEARDLLLSVVQFSGDPVPGPFHYDKFFWMKSGELV